MSIYNELEHKAQQKSQTTEEFFADLKEKIKKSRWFSCDVQANCEVYRLDKIDISFDIRKIYLVVMNKVGFENYGLSGQCKICGTAQKARIVLRIVVRCPNKKLCGKRTAKRYTTTQQKTLRC